VVGLSELPIIVETDCSQLVEATKSSTRDRLPLLHLVSDIKRPASQDRVCTLVKVERSQVRVSHYLANLARVEQHTQLWLGSGTEDALQLLESDINVTHHVK
jgi:hypothetical protein